MSDIVKRDDCLKVIDRFIGYLDEDMIYRIKLKLKQDVPTVDERPKGKWIPTTEKLPEKFKDVLCWAKSTARGGDIWFVGSCDKGCWFLQSSAGHQSYPTQYKVVAWMELPEPYKESGKE